jgi:hypothetical protein
MVVNYATNHGIEQICVFVHGVESDDFRFVEFRMNDVATESGLINVFYVAVTACDRRWLYMVDAQMAANK